MPGAELRQAPMHHFSRQFRMIAFPAEVAEIQMPQVRGNDVSRRVGRRFIREMPMPPEDALLQAPGTARAVLQHFDVVIGFQHEDVRGTDPVNNHPGHMPEICQETQGGGVRSQQKSDRILCVVGDGKSLNQHVADVETRAGAEKPEIEGGAELEANGVGRGPVAIHRDVAFPGENRQALDMIAVFVSDEDAGEIFGSAPDRGEPLANLACAESRVDQEPGLGSLDVRAVAGRTAAENRELHSHGLDVKQASRDEQRFSKWKRNCIR